MCNCKKCGAELKYSETDTLRMAGEYYAVLCTDCRNLYSQMCNNNPQFCESLVLLKQIEIVKEHMVARELIEQHFEISRKLFNLSKLFVEGGPK